MCCEGTVCGTYGQICMCFAEKTVLDAKKTGNALCNLPMHLDLTERLF